MRNSWKVPVSFFLLAAASGLCLGLEQGRNAPPPDGGWSAFDSEGRAFDRAGLEAFFDGVLSAQLQAYRIAGAAVAVVREGEVLLAKGYGLADAASGRPVEAGKTLFRMASVSKLVTWTAVMQLAEKGRLDLKRDVNDALKGFRIPDTFPQPVTLEHLMSHSAGFEDRVIGLGAWRKEDVLSLAEYVRLRRPERIRPPGVVTAYSNYGTALAGYIVQEAAGMPFDDYVERSILGPLGMKRSSFRQPPPGRLMEDVSRGHIVRADVLLPQDFEYVNGLGPAGSLSSTVTDMARFMIAHLEGGVFEGGRILSAETVRLMQTRLFSNDPRVCGNAHGFWERRANGLRLIGHGGDTWMFHSQLVLIPEKRSGLIVVYNTQTAASPARDELVQAFMDRCYPASPSSSPSVLRPPSPNPGSGERFAGWYGLSRTPASTVEKAMGLFMVLQAARTGRGTLLTRWPGGFGAREWEEIEPGVFGQVGGSDKLVFRAAEGSGEIYVFMDSMPLFAGIRLRGLKSPVFHWGLEAACLVLFLSVFLWPAEWLRHRICRGVSAAHRAPWPWRLTAFVSSLLNLVFTAVFLASLAEPQAFLLGIPAGIKWGLWLPLTSIPLTGFAAVLLVPAWRRRAWTVCGRLHFTLVVAAGVIHLLFLKYWNLLGLAG